MPWGVERGQELICLSHLSKPVSCFPSIKGTLGNSQNMHVGWKVAGVRRDIEDTVTQTQL